jgi:NADPH-dependent curcumin reductase CurA
MPETNHQVILSQKPQGKLTPASFTFAEGPIPTPAEGDVLVKAKYVSLDAANRAWMQGVTYRAGLETGEVMAGGALAEVVESRTPNLAPGDLVVAETGWQEYAAVPGERLAKLPKVEPLTHLLSVYGVTGLTAYFGLLRIGEPKPGETVVVSAAAGAVGSIAAQIAKIKGAHVIGIAGGAAKCGWLTGELGLDSAIDYKQGEVRRQLRAAAPDGVDVYFDNTGGDIFEAALFNMTNHGRIVCCGAVSQYDDIPPAHGPRGVPGLIVTKRLKVQGFVVMDFYDGREAALAELEDWVETGKLKVQEDVIDGLENLPGALIGLLAGENRGKRMVRV